MAERSGAREGARREKFSPGHSLFSLGYYGANAVYQGYMSLFYAQIGMSKPQLGGVSAATAVAALAAQPLWGMLGDRAQNRRALLCALCAASAAALPLALASEGFLWQLFAAAIFYALFCALLPLGDAILLERAGGAFGAYRLAGGASFAIVGGAFGALRGRLGASGAIWTAAGILLLAAAAAWALPNAPGRQRRARVSMVALLRDRRLLRMLGFLLPVQMTMGFFYTFYAPHFKALPGGGDALLGLGYFISAASEAPYLLLSGKIYRRFGAERPMCAAAALLCARWLLLGLSPDAGAALLSQILHGGGFIVVTVSMAHWIAENVPEELRASGQALLNMVSFGAARAAGNLLGGLLAGRIGYGGGFLAGAAVCALALCAFAPAALRRGGAGRKRSRMDANV